MLDVERFDLEPERPLLHGRVPELDPDVVEGLDREQRLALVAKIVGYGVSARAAASMLEIGATVSTWPQLASDVALGGATVCAAVRRILLRQPLPSGRRYVDLTQRITGPADPEGPPAPPPLHVELVSAAILAPSGGNCQPWLFESDGRAIDVHHLRERSRSLLDVDGIAGLRSVGAAIEGLALRAGELGHAVDVAPTGRPRAWWRGSPRARTEPRIHSPAGSGAGSPIAARPRGASSPWPRSTRCGAPSPRRVSSTSPPTRTPWRSSVGGSAPSVGCGSCTPTCTPCSR